MSVKRWYWGTGTARLWARKWENEMADLKRSRLTRMTVRNIGCIGSEGLVVELDNIVCLVGKNNAGKSTVLRAYELAKGTLPFSPVLDRHQHATPGEASEILLEVHIPDGIGNVDDRWKEKQGEARTFLGDAPGAQRTDAGSPNPRRIPEKASFTDRNPRKDKGRQEGYARGCIRRQRKDRPAHRVVGGS